MICELCKGKGWVQGQAPDIPTACSACGGKGFVDMTNEEWRKACSTEEFTEELTKVVLDIVSWNNDPKPSEVRNILKAWLKRPHAEKGSNT